MVGAARRRPFSAAAGLLVACALVLAAWAAIDLVRIALEVRAARAAVLTLDPGRLTGPRGVGFVTGQAEQRLVRADRLAHRNPLLQLGAVLPVARDQVATLRDATGRARELGGVGARTGAALQRQVDQGTGGSANRLALVEVLARSADTAAKETEALGPLPRHRWTHPVLRTMRGIVDTEQEEATVRLRDASLQADALRGLLRGPRRILVLAANNSEMLSGGGLVGSVAVAEVQDGAVKLGPFSQSSDLVLVKQGPVPLTPVQDQLWATMGFGYDFRGVTAPSDFSQAGPVAAAMAESIGLGKVDGVVMLDVVGLQQLVGVTGPVQVDEITINDQNAADELLYRNYLRFADRAGAVRAQRAELQARVGQSVFTALEERPVDLGRLFGTMRYIVGGRHLMGWSAVPGEQLLWERAGAAGQLDTEGLQVSLVNRSGNKLDYHLRPRVVVKSRRAPGGERRVRLEITTANLPRSPTTPAVEGNVPQQHYNDLVAYLPQNAADVTTDGNPFTRTGEEGGMRVVVAPLYLDIGTTVTVAIEFIIPKEQPVNVLPSARVAPIPYTVGGRTVDDDLPVQLPL